MIRSSLVFLFVALGALGASPVNAAAPSSLAGTWQGVFHGGRGDQKVSLRFLPRGDRSFGGALAMDGEEVGPIEDAALAGDSLHFHVINYRLAGARSGDTIAFSLFITNGRSHEFTVRYASPDTTTPLSARAPQHAAVPWAEVPEAVFAAHTVANDRPSGTLPCLEHGTLLLVGGGPAQSDIDARFVALAGGPRAKLVVIPTASVEPGDSALARDIGRKTGESYGIADVTVLDATSRKEADSETFVAPLRRATAVWLTGGEGGFLIARYLGTRTERELLALLDRGGVIGGSSAGALVWGSESMLFRAPPGNTPYAMPGPDDLIVGSPRAVGFGVLRNVLVSPHFTEFKMAPILEKDLAARKGLLGFGIDEATALEVHGDVATVLGRGHVSVYGGLAPRGVPMLKLEAGARYDVARRTILAPHP